MHHALQHGDLLTCVPVVVERVVAVMKCTICRLAAPALAALVLFPGAATAAVVCHAGVNLAVPQTSEGLYVNFITRTSGLTEGSVPGFDFDPYAAANTVPADQLRFYWGALQSNPDMNNGGVVSSGNTYAVLQPGDSIGPASTFSRAAFTGDTAVWQAGLTGAYLGARFRNETTSVMNYGWVRLTTTPPQGFPLTVLDWCYEDSGATITIPPPPPDQIFLDGFDAAAP